MREQKRIQEEIPERLWTTNETASFLGITVSTLCQMTYKGSGPKCYKVGKYRRFKPREVLLWVNSLAIGGVN
jgi:predicted DNA-binding transcriptional regulator AlpA